MFTLQDLTMLRDRAIRLFGDYSGRCRLPGMTRDLTEDERRMMAFYEASAIHLSQFDAGPVNIIDFLPAPYTAVNEVVEDGVAVYNQTQQKK